MRLNTSDIGREKGKKKKRRARIKKEATSSANEGK